MRYTILKSHSIETLVAEVERFTTNTGTEWKFAGGPFLEPYSAGEGPCLDPGSRGDTPEWRAPVFVNFCQALYREG